MKKKTKKGGKWIPIMILYFIFLNKKFDVSASLVACCFFVVIVRFLSIHLLLDVFYFDSHSFFYRSIELQLLSFFRMRWWWQWMLFALSNTSYGYFSGRFCALQPPCLFWSMHSEYQLIYIFNDTHFFFLFIPQFFFCRTQVRSGKILWPKRISCMYAYGKYLNGILSISLYH